MRVFKRGNIWYIDCSSGGRRIRKRVGTSRKEAERALAVIQGKIYSGTFDINVYSKTITFRELADAYIKHAKAHKKSWRRDMTSLRKLLIEFGDMRLDDITPFHIENYQLKRREEVSPASCNREIQCLKYMLNLGLRWGKNSKNPAREVKLFKERNGRLRFLSEDEIIRLIDSCSDQLRPVVITAVYTGMRRGEILNLKWDDINFERNLIQIDETKSGSPRDVPMSDFLRETMLALKSRSSHEYVFVNRLGKPYRDVRESFSRALKKAQIKDCTFHTLRHTAASFLVMSNVDLVTVKEILGHKTIQMTMRYSHLTGKHKQQAMNILQRRIEGWHKSGTKDKKAIDKIAEKPYKY